MYVLESHSLENVPLIYMGELIFKSRRKVIISGFSGLLELGGNDKRTAADLRQAWSLYKFQDGQDYCFPNFLASKTKQTHEHKNRMIPQLWKACLASVFLHN